MESKIASGVHAARQCGWRGSAGAAYLVWMPQLDGKGSPRGAVTGVERGSEVERLVLVRHTAVLACVCVGNPSTPRVLTFSYNLTSLTMRSPQMFEDTFQAPL